MKLKLVIGLMLVLFSGFGVGKGFAEPACDYDDGSPCCESGCFEYVGVGVGGDWDNFEPDENNNPQWDYWGEGTNAGWICLLECENNEEPDFLTPENECWIAKDPFAGEPCWEVYTQSDWRYYHDSATNGDKLYNPGGYKLGFAYWNMETPPNTTVEFHGSNGYTYSVKHLQPYTFVNIPIIEYLLWLGYDKNAEGVWTVKVNGNTIKEEVTIPMNQPKLPVVKIHRLSGTPQGERVIFSAPMVENFDRIRLRVIDPNTSDFVWENQWRQAGRTMSILVPPEFSGYPARFEYRASDVEGTCGGCVRTLLYFTLP